jgi:hypothetical protein
MKTVKTILGTKQISSDAVIMMEQLREALQDYRSEVVDKVLSGLDTYVGWRFDGKATQKQLEIIKERLFALKVTALKIENYPAVIEQAIEKDLINVDGVTLYSEVDKVIEDHLTPTTESELTYEQIAEYKFDGKTFIEFHRKEQVAKIQTEKGLREYIKEKYNATVTDPLKMLYLINEVQEFYQKEPTDYKWLHQLWKQNKFSDFEKGNNLIIETELSPILDRHFVGITNGVQ